MNKIKLAISKWWVALAVENKRLLIAVAIGLLVGFILCAASTPAGASERHHYSSMTQIEQCAPTAVAAASGQHHYKATPSLQWSFAAVYLDAEGCDNTAASTGLAMQNGKVLNTLNFSSNGNENIIGITASGVF